MHFEKGRVYLIGAVDTDLDVVVEWKKYECSTCTHREIHLVNVKARVDGWPMSLSFNRNLFRIKSNDFYKYKKFLLFDSMKEIESYNKKSYIYS